MDAEPALHRLERVGSTMDALHALADAGAPAGTAVLAREQTAGRGSRRRDWASPPGGLWLSVLQRPGVPSGAELVSIRAGLAVCAALAEIPTLPPVRLKWPNDLMLGEAKVGGILCEARWQGDSVAWVAVGVGLNVRNSLPPCMRIAAARLADADPDVEPQALAEPVVRWLRRLHGAGHLLPEELAAFDRRDWLRGRRLAAPCRGVAAGVGPDGTLRVRTGSDPAVKVRTGPVELEPSRQGSACC